MRFSDQVVWITGASSGIGEALVKAFHDEGAKVILSARRQAELERVKQAAGGGDGLFVLPLDLEDIDGIPAKAAAAQEKYGRIDILVNNAGISQRSLAKDTDLKVDERIMKLDWLSQVALTKAVMPDMIARHSGTILVVSSVAGMVGTPFRTSYAAAKHALRGYFDSLRAELHREGVHVCVAYPGYINTPITVSALKGDGSEFQAMGESQQAGMSPEKCADILLDAVYKKKDETFPGGKEVLSIYIKRFFPSLVSRMIRNYKVT